MRAIDAIEPRFRPMYEKICVGNKRSDAQHVFFEGMLLEKGLGAFDVMSQSVPAVAMGADNDCHRRRRAMVWEIFMGPPGLRS